MLKHINGHLVERAMKYEVKLMDGNWIQYIGCATRGKPSFPPLQDLGTSIIKQQLMSWRAAADSAKTALGLTDISRDCFFRCQYG
jgi:hypothetical protein